MKTEPAVRILLALALLASVGMACDLSSLTDLLNPGGGGPVVVHEGWTSFSNGNEIRGLALQDGALWAATAGGVFRWNLADGTYVRIASEHGLASNNTRAVLVDSAGVLWVGTESGLSRFDGEIWTTYTTADGLLSNEVFDVLEEPSGNILVGTYEGLNRFDGTNWTALSADLKSATAMTLDAAGNIWVARPCNGVVRFGGNWEPRAEERWYTKDDDHLPTDCVRDVYVDPSETVWLATSKGVVRMAGSNLTTYAKDDGIPNDDVQTIIADGSGAIWIGTGAGIGKFDGTTWQTYIPEQQGAADNSVAAILADPSGTMWFGMENAGISRFDGSAWTVYLTEDNPPANSISHIAVDQSGALWLDADPMVSRFDGTNWSNYDSIGEYSADDVTSIYVDASGKVWLGRQSPREIRILVCILLTLIGQNTGTLCEAGTIAQVDPGGIVSFNAGAWTSYNFSSENYIGSVSSIFQDSNGVMWFGGSSGVLRFDGSSWTLYKSSTKANAEGLTTSGIGAIYQDSSGALWFGGSTGVSRFDGMTWEKYTETSGLAEKHVNAIAENPPGILWFATNEGLSHFDGYGWTTYTTSQGLPNDTVYALLVDSRGRLWAGTQGGAAFFDGENWTAFTTLDGLAAKTVYGIAEDLSGALWFATNGGLSRYIPPR